MPETPVDVEVWLHELLPDVDLERYMDFEEEDEQLIIKIISRLGKHDWVMIHDLVLKHGGEYDSHKQRWTLAKPKIEEQPKLVPGYEKMQQRIETKLEETTPINHDAETIKASESEIGQIYPVVKDQFGNILDGFHRKDVDPNWKETTVDVADPLHALRIRVHANVIRRDISWDEKHKWVTEARRLLNPNDPTQPSQREVAKVLGLGKSWVYQYDTCPGSGQGKLDYQLYNVWKTFKLNPRFGADSPGRTPHQIIANLLYYYTDENDLVLDPMAGGGTVIDVCATMNRKCLAFDINPCRKDIVKNDVLKVLPLDEKCDFIFLDPPYYKQKEGYIENQFNSSIESFYEAMRTTLLNCFGVLKEKGTLALMLKPMGLRESGMFEWEDLTLKCHVLAIEIGFKLIKRICAPLSTQQYERLDVARAKKNRYMLNTLRDILVFQK